MSSNQVHGGVYSIQHYVIKFVSDLQQVGGFFPGTPASSTNKTDRHDITDILLKVVLKTTSLTYKHFTLARPIHVSMDIRIMVWDMHTNVMIVNWIPKRQYRYTRRIKDIEFYHCNGSSE